MIDWLIFFSETKNILKNTAQLNDPSWQVEHAPGLSSWPLQGTSSETQPIAVPQLATGQGVLAKKMMLELNGVQQK